MLEIKNSRDALSNLDDDEKGVALTDTHGGKQKVGVINEYGLYSITLRSRKPEAHQFKRWITHEVIPAIRKTGGYIPTDGADDFEILCRAVLIAQKTIEEKNAIIEKQNAKIASDAPSVEFAVSVGQAKSSISIGDFAKLLYEKGHREIGRTRLFSTMRDEKILDGQNMPYQKYMEAGWFDVIEVAHNGKLFKQPRLTGKGQQKLYDRLFGNLGNVQSQ